MQSTTRMKRRRKFILELAAQRSRSQHEATLSLINGLPKHRIFNLQLELLQLRLQVAGQLHPLQLVLRLWQLLPL